MISIGRFVTRSAREDGKVDLLLGSAFKTETYFKPNHIYEICTIMGEIHIKCIGKSAIKDPSERSKLHINWGFSVNEIISADGLHLLTETEAESLNSNK